MRPALAPLPALNSRPHTPVEVAYEQYRLERQGDRLRLTCRRLDLIAAQNRLAPSLPVGFRLAARRIPSSAVAVGSRLHLVHGSSSVSETGGGVP
jgi:hypothetical protein